MKLVSQLPKQSFWLYMGPVLNVSLVLIIFLLLSPSFVVQSGVQVALPESGSRLTQFENARILTITLNPEQIYYLDGHPIQLRNLRDTLTEKHSENRRIILHIDKMAPFEWVQRALNLTLELGYEVGYATDPTSR